MYSNGEKVLYLDPIGPIKTAKILNQRFTEKGNRYFIELNPDIQGDKSQFTVYHNDITPIYFRGSNVYIRTWDGTKPGQVVALVEHDEMGYAYQVMLPDDSISLYDPRRVYKY